MDKKNNTHPSIEEILKFVNHNGEIDVRQTANLITHFYHCDSCRRIKDEILEFNEILEKQLDLIPKNINGLQLARIVFSVEKMNNKITPTLNPMDFIFSIEGSVSKTIAQSQLYLSKLIQNKLDFDIDFGYAVPAGSRSSGQERKNDIIDENNNMNRIHLEENHFSISLYDDTAERHTLLLIPNGEVSEPKIYEMKKNNCVWRVEDDIKTGVYNFVIF